MMRFLTVEEILDLHDRVIKVSGGLAGVRQLGDLEKAVAQPQMAFGGQELYVGRAEKAAALGFSLICNHPFVDGNKRIRHAALETFLVLNAWELDATVDDQERIILAVADATIGRDDFVAWVASHMRPKAS